MDRPKRTIKPNMRYDPNIYVLASFPKKKKHTVIPKHQVVVDVIDEHNGIIKSSGFPQPVRIIAEGTLAKCQERTTQFSRQTGSEEIDIPPVNNEEDKEYDGDEVFTLKNPFYEEAANYPPPTSDCYQVGNAKESTLDFSVVDAYNNNKTRKRFSFDDDSPIENEIIDITERNLNEDASPSAPLIIDEQSNDNHHEQHYLEGEGENSSQDRFRPCLRDSSVDY